MNEKQLHEIDVRAEAATPMEIPVWNWEVVGVDYCAHVESPCKTAGTLQEARELIEADIKFLATARSDILALTNEIRRLRAVLAEYADRMHWGFGTPGHRDLWIPTFNGYTRAEEALKDGGNSQVTIMKMPGLNHMLQVCRTGTMSEYATIEETIAPVVLETIHQWIVDHLQ